MKPDYVLQTYIRCSLDALWDALTDPAIIGQYHFLTEHVEKAGDTTRYAFAPGQPMMTARDIHLEPKTLIEQTFEPHWEGGGAPSRTVFHLCEEGSVCALTLEHYELGAPAIHGQGIADGWARLCAGLKTHLETGQTVRFNQEATA